MNRSARRPIEFVCQSETIDVATLSGEKPLVLVAADAVFDRTRVGVDASTAGSPLQLIRAAEAEAVARDPQRWLDSIGQGRVDGPGFALRVVDGKSATTARRALLRSLRKPIDGFVSRHLNRPVSLAISGRLASSPVTPNQITAIVALVALSGAVLAALARPWWMLVLAAALFQAQSILDGCDGEIARLTYRSSRLGAWLDSICDDVTNYAFCFGLAAGQARTLDQPALWYAGGITLALQVCMSGVLYHRMVRLGTGGDLLALPYVSGPADGGRGLRARLMRVVRQVARRDSFIFAVALVTALQLPLLAFWIFAAGSWAVVATVIVSDWRLARARAAPERPALLPAGRRSKGGEV